MCESTRVKPGHDGRGDARRRSRGTKCPSLASFTAHRKFRGRRESRVPIAPMGPVQQKKHGGRTTGEPEQRRLSLRGGLRLTSRSPR
jgi:hypothetical protein